jgi:uncharacterized membrane protein
MSGLVTVVLALVMIAYPLLIYWGLARLQPRLIAVFVVAIFALRLAVLSGSEQVRQFLPLLIGVICTSLIVVVANTPTFLLVNPALINLVFLGVFLSTLSKPPSMIERFARIQEPNLPDAAIEYCRSVTKVWCVFFLLNAGVSLYTVLIAVKTDKLGAWTLYNGLISYVLIGLLFAVEFVVRMRVKRRIDAELAEGQHS